MNEEKTTVEAPAAAGAAPVQGAAQTEPEVKTTPKNSETADPKPRRKKAKQAEPDAASELAAELTSAVKQVGKPKAAKQAAAKDELTTKKPRLKKTAETITLGELAEQYVAALEEEGKSDGTLFSYKLEMRTALAALGETTRLADLTARKVGNFFGSDKVTKTRTGRQKSPLSIAKTIRVLSQALAFAEEQGLVAEAPLPKQD